MSVYMYIGIFLVVGLVLMNFYKQYVMSFVALDLSIGNTVKLSSSGQMSVSIEDLIKSDHIKNDLLILRRIAH